MSLENVNINGANFVGGLVGYNYGMVDNCHVNGTVIGVEWVGGIVGVNQEGGVIISCNSIGSVSGVCLVGGLCGFNYASTIIDCYSTCTVNDKFSVAYAIGGLVGSNMGDISNSYATGSVRGTEEIGGLIGSAHGDISNSYATGSVSGDNEVGGLCGRSGSNTITQCYAIGNITGDSNIGGLCGYNSSTITDCYASGTITGGDYSGGLTGSNGGTITQCYALGLVSGNGSIGGLIGRNFIEGDGDYIFGVVLNAFWDIESSGQLISDGGTGRTTAQLQRADNYIGWSNCSHEAVWVLDEDNDYPHLIWEGTPGSVLPEYTLSDFMPGSGSENDPYQISTAEQLNRIGLFTCELDKHFVLMADIDLFDYEGMEFNIIGKDWDNPFNGIFDGNGFRIMNFTYDAPDEAYVGLFAHIGQDGVLENLALVDVNIIGKEYVGSLASVNSGTVTNCYVSGKIVGSGQEYYSGVGGLVGSNDEYASLNECYSTATITGTEKVGGLVGYNGYAANITSCHATGSVSGDYVVGGLVGYNDFGVITSCYATGPVDGIGAVGGLVGSSDGDIIACYASGDVNGAMWIGGLLGSNDGVLTDCYATGSVSGDYVVGGLAGEDRYFGVITTCYATGSVSGFEFSGGLVGNKKNYYGSLPATNCFWDIQTTGQITSAGGTGKSTTEMKTQTTFTGAVWDFDTVWTICEGTNYPRLQWQVPVADFVCPAGVGLDDFSLLGRCWQESVGLIGDITGDYHVNLEDFSLLSEYWLQNGCNDCGGADISGDATVGSEDLLLMTEHWLQTVDSACSLADMNKDGTVNFTDLIIFAEYWLEGQTQKPLQYGGGSRTEDDPFLIYEAEQLNTIESSGDWSRCFRQMADIDLSFYTGKEFKIIRNFTGVFDGNGYRILNFTYESPAQDNVGLFGIIHEGGVVKNLGMENVNIIGGSYVGGLARLNKGKIANCYVTGFINGDSEIGGLVGFNNESGTISSCYVTGSVGGSYRVGGLVGENEYGTITGCYATGSVSGSDSYVGGLVGTNYYGTITVCYAAGSVSGYYDIGGLVGGGWGDNILDCFWDIDTSSQTTSAGGTGKTTTEMKTLSTFTDAGWDFETIWQMPAGGYPHLRWEPFGP